LVLRSCFRVFFVFCAILDHWHAGAGEQASSVADLAAEKEKGKGDEDGKKSESLAVEDTHASAKEE
jgi:hypothetical protein